MQRIYKIEQENHFELPTLYKEILASFDLFMLLDFKGKDIDLTNRNLLTEFVKKEVQNWQYVTIWASEDERIQNNRVRRHDIDNESIDIGRLKNSFMFGSYGDGVRLYFDIQDNMSVWEYWLDEGSVGKIANGFDELLSESEIIEQE